MKKHVYHYHAFWQAEIGSTHHVDGIVFMDEKIVTGEAYQEARKAIEEQNNGAMVVLGSLSYMGEVNEAD